MFCVAVHILRGIVFDLFAHMAIALFLLALGLFNVSAMDVLNAPAAYCGGAGGDGGDDGDNWGNWKGQWLKKVEEPTQKNINNKKTLVTLLSTLEMGSASLMRNDEEGDWLEFEEEDFEHGNWDDIEFPEEAITFPSHIPENSPAFRHILFEGAHCLL